MAESVEIYPRGFIAMGGSDFVTATNIKVSMKNNAKQVHTLRRTGAGVTKGNEETTVTFDCAVGELGEEADFLKAIKRLTIKQIRVKIPLRTMTINGAFDGIDYDIPLDTQIVESVSFIGHMVD